MNLCKSNFEGEACNEPVQSGGYCKYHQKAQDYGKRRKSMKPHKMKKRARIYEAS